MNWEGVVLSESVHAVVLTGIAVISLMNTAAILYLIHQTRQSSAIVLEARVRRTEERLDANDVERSRMRTEFLSAQRDNVHVNGQVLLKFEQLEQHVDLGFESLRQMIGLSGRVADAKETGS